MNKFEKLAIDTAAKSPCEKRKVGAVITGMTELISVEVVLATGYNFNPCFHSQDCCEDEEGKTKLEVVHAEVEAIRALKVGPKYKPIAIYVTHEPCDNCRKAIEEANIPNIIIVESFLKFDKNKINYSLVPSEWLELDAKVLTIGAKKYKPNNWRTISNKDVMRYLSAAMRHIQYFRKYMEDKEGSELFDNGEGGIGTHHLANARVNLGFLLTLTETEEKANEIRNSNRTS